MMLTEHNTKVTSTDCGVGGVEGASLRIRPVLGFVGKGCYTNPGPAGLWGEGTTESDPQPAVS